MYSNVGSASRSAEGDLRKYREKVLTMKSILLFCRLLLLWILIWGITTTCIGEADSSAGALQFRIAPATAQGSQTPSQLTEEVITQARKDLQANGPLAAISRDDEYVWFEMMSGVKVPEFLITEEYQGLQYLLVHNWPPFVIWPGIDWGLERISKGKDNNGRTCVQFQLDTAGAEFFYSLTAANVGRHLAMIVDGKVASAPNINTAARRLGIISGDFNEKQIENMINILQKAIVLTPIPAPATRATGTYMVPVVLFILIVVILVLLVYR